jgi:hypothetical protein
MNKKFILALMLASGLAFAQSSGSSPGSSDQQPSAQQTQPPSGQTTSPASAGQSSLTGCLKGSDSGWVLVAEGQSTPIKGDSSTLGPHNGHQVQVKGSQASDGSFTVTDVVMIADTCTRQQDTSASSAAGAATGAAAGVAARNVSYNGQATQNPPPSDAANPAQSAPSSTQGATAPQSTAPPSSTAPDTSTPQSTSTTPQSTTPPTTGTTPSTSTDQSAAASPSGHQKLPQSASPLPLLGLLGLGSLATGLFARRKK